MGNGVTTIIPTTASAARAASIRRAVESIRAASTQPSSIVVVVNGQKADAEVCGWLEAQSDTRVEYLAAPSLVAALLKGRQVIETPYFSLLDDDDEYLPLATDVRLRLMTSTVHPDVVVSPGIRLAGVEETVFPALSDAMRDPLSAALTNIWLCSCSALYRTQSIGPEYFEDIHAGAEWTWLAFKMAMDGKKILALDMPTFRINDTPASLSKTSAYSEAYLPLFKRMLALGPPPAIVRHIRRRMGDDLHDRSVRALSGGKRLEAVRNHLASLSCPGGLKYLSYTRRLLM